MQHWTHSACSWYVRVCAHVARASKFYYRLLRTGEEDVGAIIGRVCQVMDNVGSIWANKLAKEHDWSACDMNAVLQLYITWVCGWAGVGCNWWVNECMDAYKCIIILLVVCMLCDKTEHTLGGSYCVKCGFRTAAVCRWEGAPLNHVYILCEWLHDLCTCHLHTVLQCSHLIKAGYLYRDIQTPMARLLHHIGNLHITWLLWIQQYDEHAHVLMMLIQILHM